MVILNTTVWVDYFRGFENAETDWLNAEAGRRRLGLTDLILCEVLQGVRDDLVLKPVERELLKFEVFETGGKDLAIAAARNFRTLRRQGHTVGRRSIA